ncbi:MAG: hypothetical protein ACYSUI_14025, partial [Planctomycetota bacterium]
VFHPGLDQGEVEQLPMPRRSPQDCASEVLDLPAERTGQHPPLTGKIKEEPRPTANPSESPSGTPATAE